MNCPLCFASLDGAVDTGSGVQCPSCNHLWRVVDGGPRATNPRVDGPLTAAAVTALIPHEVTS